MVQMGWLMVEHSFNNFCYFVWFSFIQINLIYKCSVVVWNSLSILFINFSIPKICGIFKWSALGTVGSNVIMIFSIDWDTMVNTEPKITIYFFFLQIESFFSIPLLLAVTRLIIRFFLFLFFAVFIKNVLYSLAFGIFISAWILFSVLKQCDLIFSVCVFFLLVFHWTDGTCSDQQPATHRQYYENAFAHNLHLIFININS